MNTDANKNIQYVEDESGEIEPVMDNLLSKQVYLNAKAIANLDHTLGGIVNPDSPGIEPSVEGTGDVRGKFPDLSVIGSHGLTDKIDDNLPPSSYNRLITVEIKNCSAVGLNSVAGTTATQCILQTWKPLSQGISDIKAFQNAYVNDMMAFKREEIPDTDSWGEWEKGVAGGGSGNSGGEIVSPEEPDPGEQAEGDYWDEPIVGVPEYNPTE